MEEEIELLDVVVLTKPIPALGLRKGAIGTVVELLDKDVFLVEFADTNGTAYAMPVLSAAELMKVYYQPA
ncbi:MAG: DUF4926 domain-containing protein [Bacteroidetes bacterium]|nr:DUF4926 domain-containing protein [Bacteroidota bacterium]